MKRGIERELHVVVRVLLALQLITSFGALTLLGRMSPAIERILAENVSSVDSVVTMLVELGRNGPLDERRSAFEAALRRVEANVTEPEEIPVLARIEDHWQAALSEENNVEARQVVLTALRELADVNRDSMESADSRAKLLGTAGAWSATFLGLLALALTAVLVRRLGRRVVKPLEELGSVADAAAHGDFHRRCHPSGPDDIRTIGEALNRLLDARTSSGREQRLVQSDRAALLHLIDRDEAPVILFDAGGNVLAQNRAATAAAERGRPPIDQILAHAVSKEPAPAGLERVDEVVQDRAWLARLRD